MQPIVQKRRIVIGDIHGELNGFREILRNAGLIDGNENWNGGDNVLIQTGDVIDRGPYSREVADFLRKLQQEAPGANGEVIRLCGNHELMLLQHNFSYVNFKDPESFIAELKEEIAGGAVRAAYTDGNRLYTHAGLRSAIRETLVVEMKSVTPTTKSKKINLFNLSDHINKIFRDCVEKGELYTHPIFHVEPIRGGVDPVGGIFWCDFSTISPSAEAWMIPQIFGHTPSKKNGLKTSHGLKLIDVDAGMCCYYGGARVYIEITPEGQLLQHSKSLSEWTEELLNKIEGDSMRGLKSYSRKGICAPIPKEILFDRPIAPLHGGGEKDSFLWGTKIASQKEYAILRVSDGRKVSLGSPEEFRQVAHEITDYTGGSSGGGAFSALWGLLCDHEQNAHPFRVDHANMIAQEAACFRSKYNVGLSKQANALLHQLASLFKPKPSKIAILAAQGQTIPDVISLNLTVLFCGINPSLYSAAVGYHFARPGNRFWKMLYEAGFTFDQLSPCEESMLLTYRYGITDIVEVATAGANELTQSDYENGMKNLRTKVLQYKPKFVAVLGIGPYRKAFLRPHAEIGRQMEKIGESTLWVLPNPSGLNGHYQPERLKQLAQELRKAIFEDLSE